MTHPRIPLSYQRHYQRRPDPACRVVAIVLVAIFLGVVSVSFLAWALGVVG